jgi:hypothetical protein
MIFNKILVERIGEIRVLNIDRARVGGNPNSMASPNIKESRDENKKRQ